MPAGLALGKATVNGAGAVTVVFLCRVPPGLSAKRALPINFLPRVLCRVPHSTKALSSAIWPLPSASEPESSSDLYVCVARLTDKTGVSVTHACTDEAIRMLTHI